MKAQTYSRSYHKEQVDASIPDRELVFRLLAYLKPYRILLLIAVFFLLVSKMLEASVPIFVGNLSQKILDSAFRSSVEKGHILSLVLKEGLLIFAVLFISYLLDSFNIVLKSWIGQKGLYTLRMQTYEHTLNMPLVYFDKHAVGRLMTRTIHDVDQINLMFSESVIPILGNLFLFFCIFIGIAIIDWRIALMVLFVLPFVWWLTHRFRYYQRQSYDRIRTVVAAMNTFVQEQLMGASTVRNFGLQKQAKQQFEEINEDQCNAYLDSVEHFAFFMASIDLFQSLCLIFAFVIIVAFAPFNTGFEAGTYFTFSLYVLMFFRPLADLAERYNVLQAAMAAASRIFNLLDTPSETSLDSGAKELKDIFSITFEDVWFAYENENWILRGLSLEMRKGESYALVGMTGEGKSTIINLLLRFYDHQRGVIKINGIDIREYSLHALRQMFSVVLQDPVLFSGSVAENISLFNPSIERNKIESVIEHLGMDSRIQQLSRGLDYVLHERGKGLSIGEMQLISLARAMAYERPMLILDEATANIDSSTEQIIQRVLKKILGETTAFVIAHRLSTIKDVSRIFVLQNGKIIEEGTHESLLAKHGVYEKLHQLQFTRSSFTVL